jgi:hypothetical protein
MAVNKKPNKVIKGYKTANKTVQIFDFVCMKRVKMKLERFILMKADYEILITYTITQVGSDSFVIW